MSKNPLRSVLEQAAEAYHNGTPFLSDAEYDKLEELANYKLLGTKGGEYKHYHRMWSLQKYYVGDDTPRLKNPFKSPKIDGAAISLLYVEGELVRAITRGDGIAGDDITDKAKIIPNIPNTIAHKGVLQITGEVAAKKEILNARNYTSGALKLLDIEEFKTREVAFFAYDAFPNLHTSYNTALGILTSLGFDTVANESLEFIYPTDGYVYREDSYEWFDTAGYTAKHPRAAYALKNAQDVETVQTKLTDVVWQVGGGKKITPVAILEPVRIEDALVSRASLHNAGFVENLDLHVGDILLITRSGGIIPKVLGKV